MSSFTPIRTEAEYKIATAADNRTLFLVEKIKGSSRRYDLEVRNPDGTPQGGLSYITAEDLAACAQIAGARLPADLIVQVTSALHEINALPPTSTIARAKALANEALAALQRIVP